MKITHRAPADASAPAPVTTSVVQALPAGLAASQPVPRLACCCRLSELLPLVRQAHDAARAARLAGEQAEQAA